LGEPDGFGGGKNVPPAPSVKLLDGLFVQAAETSEHAKLEIGHLNEVNEEKSIAGSSPTRT